MPQKLKVTTMPPHILSSRHHWLATSLTVTSLTLGVFGTTMVARADTPATTQPTSSAVTTTTAPAKSSVPLKTTPTATPSSSADLAAKPAKPTIKVPASQAPTTAAPASTAPTTTVTTPDQVTTTTPGGTDEDSDSSVPVTPNTTGMVTVNGVNQTGSLLNQQVMTGEVGAIYQASAATLAGYQVVGSASQSGTYTETPQTIIFTYRPVLTSTADDNQNIADSADDQTVSNTDQDQVVPASNPTTSKSTILTKFTTTTPSATDSTTNQASPAPTPTTTQPHSAPTRVANTSQAVTPTTPTANPSTPSKSKAALRTAPKTTEADFDLPQVENDVAESQNVFVSLGLLLTVLGFGSLVGLRWHNRDR